MLEPTPRYATPTTAPSSRSSPWRAIAAGRMQQGEAQEETEWFNIVCFARLAEIAGDYLNKGSHVYVEGRLHTRAYEDEPCYPYYKVPCSLPTTGCRPMVFTRHRLRVVVRILAESGTVTLADSSSAASRQSPPSAPWSRQPRCQDRSSAVAPARGDRPTSTRRRAGAVPCARS